MSFLGDKNFNDEKLCRQSSPECRQRPEYCAILPQRFMECVYWSLLSLVQKLVCSGNDLTQLSWVWTDMKKKTKKSWSSMTLKKGPYLYIKIQCYWSSFSLPFFPYQFMLEITVFLIDWSGRKYCSNLFHNHFFSFLTSRTLARI